MNSLFALKKKSLPQKKIPRAGSGLPPRKHAIYFGDLSANLSPGQAETSQLGAKIKRWLRRTGEGGKKVGAGGAGEGIRSFFPGKKDGIIPPAL